MGNTDAGSRGTWATYVRAARERAGLGITDLAKRVGKDRGTVYRWEAKNRRPDDPEIVAAVAEVLRLDIDEALAAAGMRPGAKPPAEPVQEVDEERALILSSNASPRLKAVMLERLEELRERDRLRRMEDIRFLLERGA